MEDVYPINDFTTTHKNNFIIYFKISNIYCSACVEKSIGNTCPECGLPSHVKDVSSSRQLETAVALCQNLSFLLLKDSLNLPGSVVMSAVKVVIFCFRKLGGFYPWVFCIDFTSRKKTRHISKSVVCKGVVINYGENLGSKTLRPSLSRQGNNFKRWKLFAPRLQYG